MLIRVLATGVAGLVLAADSPAQVTVRGARVRVQLLTGDRGSLVGGVIRETADSLALATDRGRVTLGWAAIDRVERSLGRSPLRGAAPTGLAVGAGLGLGYSIYTLAADSCEGEACLVRGLVAPVIVTLSVFAGGVVGLGVGAIAGQAIRVERWTSVWPPRAPPGTVAATWQVGWQVPISLR